MNYQHLVWWKFKPVNQKNHKDILKPPETTEMVIVPKVSPAPLKAPLKIVDQARMNIMKALSWVPHIARFQVAEEEFESKKTPINAGVANKLIKEIIRA